MINWLWFIVGTLALGIPCTHCIFFFFKVGKRVILLTTVWQIRMCTRVFVWYSPGILLCLQQFYNNFIELKTVIYSIPEYSSKLMEENTNYISNIVWRHGGQPSPSEMDQEVFAKPLTSSVYLPCDTPRQICS